MYYIKKKKKKGLRRWAWIKGVKLGGGLPGGCPGQATTVGGEEGVPDSHPPHMVISPPP